MCKPVTGPNSSPQALVGSLTVSIHFFWLKDLGMGEHVEFSVGRQASGEQGQAGGGQLALREHRPERTTGIGPRVLHLLSCREQGWLQVQVLDLSTGV